MKKLGNTAPLFILLFFCINAFAQSNLNAEDREVVRDAEKARESFIAQDPDIRQMFEQSAGYVIFPNVGKGAYVVGGAAGNGAVYQNGELVGMAKLRQLDVGLQLGGQSYSQVIFFENEKTLNSFKEDDVQLAANASAVALDEGKAKSLKFKDGLAIATMPKAGAMLEISVGGQKFRYSPLE